MFRYCHHLLWAFLLLLTGCDKVSPNKPVVLVSIAPQSDFVEKIAGAIVDVHTLVPSGANPHFFEPSPKQVSEIANAAIWFRIGEAFETRAIDFLSDRKVEIVDTRKNIPLIPCEGCHGHGAEDTHIWLSPRLVKIQAATIAEALIEKFPKHRLEFEKNLAKFQAQLDTLDENIKALMQPLTIRTIFVSHPAFGYFCRDYNLTQLSIEQAGQEPSPQYITQLISTVRKEKLRAVYTFKQYNNKAAELIAKPLNLNIVWLDPYLPNYLENMLFMASQFAKYSS